MKRQTTPKKSTNIDVNKTNQLINDSRNEEEEEKNDKLKYHCSLCKYDANNKSNLHTHYQSKKHISHVIDVSMNLDIFYKELANFRDNNKQLIEKYKNDKYIKSNYSDIENLLKTQIDVISITLAKTEDEKNYICTGCGKKFENKIKYKMHINECAQVEFKYKLLKEITIELVIQSKQFQEVCATKTMTPFMRSSIKDKKIKDLEEKNKDLEEKLKEINERIHVTQNIANEKIKKISKKLDFKCDKLKKVKEQIIIMDCEIQKLNLNNKVFEEKYKNIETINKKLEDTNKNLQIGIHKNLDIQNNSSTSGTNNIYNNGKMTLQLIFNNSPAFEYVNPFIDKETEMPHNYDLPKEQLILADNKDQPKEIQAKLCHATAFWDLYKNNELIDFVANAIVHTYAKSNINEQSIWNTDTTRNTYNIRTRNDKTEIDFWQKDKEGVLLKQILLKPIKQYLHDSMCTYHHYCTQKHLGKKTSDFVYPATKEMNELYYKFMRYGLDNLTDEETISLTTLFCTIVQLKKYLIDDENFSKEVLKKMASRFYFNKNKCLMECNTEAEKKEVLKEISKIESLEENDLEEIKDLTYSEIIEDSEVETEESIAYIRNLNKRSEVQYLSDDSSDKKSKKVFNKKSKHIKKSRRNEPFATPFK